MIFYYFEIILIIFLYEFIDQNDPCSRGPCKSDEICAPHPDIQNKYLCLKNNNLMIENEPEIEIDSVVTTTSSTSTHAKVTKIQRRKFTTKTSTTTTSTTTTTTSTTQTTATTTQETGKLKVI